MYKKTFKPQLLAASIATILATSTYAQDGSSVNEDDSTEVIEIKGIRGSLMRSMDLKRESMGVVDGISAEDIGKFPDTNLAESLQRITGVAI